MGRKPINKSINTSIEFEKGTEFRLFDVKVPFVYSITVKTTNPNIVKTGTVREYYAKSDFDLDSIKKGIENDSFGYKIVKIEQSTRQLTDLCPRCHMRGIPKIEKKDASDNRERSWRNKEETTRNERPQEFWLTYTHNKNKKCRIRQYVNTPYPAYKQNKIDIEKYFFPFALMNMQNGSLRYVD